MTSQVASIALFAPVVASNAVFSVRRASRGVEAIDENPVYAAMNMDIAAAQVTKGARAAKALSIISEGGSKEAIEKATNVTKGAAENIKNASKTAKFLKGTQKVINFTADHINPVICVTSGVKVLNSEDKPQATAEETIRLGTMFGAEAIAKRVVGMPYTKKVNGKNITFKREGLGEQFYNDVFSAKQKEALEQFAKTKTFVKYLPSAAKGLLFVGASIGGYKLGDKIVNNIFVPEQQRA